MINIGGYTFKDQKLIDRALTHSSFSAKNYERLEFLGDSILDFLVAEIYYQDANMSESELTRLRASTVSEENLSVIFDKLNIKNLVKLGKSCPSVTKAIKCDIVESVIASIYLESGLSVAKKFITDNFSFNINETKDYKTQFQEFAQKEKLLFEYKLEKTEGPAHKLIFFVSLIVNGKKISSASANGKSEAEKLCAEKALNLLK